MMSAASNEPVFNQDAWQNGTYGQCAASMAFDLNATIIEAVRFIESFYEDDDLPHTKLLAHQHQTLWNRLWYGRADLTVYGIRLFADNPDLGRPRDEYMVLMGGAAYIAVRPSVSHRYTLLTPDMYIDLYVVDGYHLRAPLAKAIAAFADILEGAVMNLPPSHTARAVATTWRQRALTLETGKINRKD